MSKTRLLRAYLSLALFTSFAISLPAVPLSSPHPSPIKDFLALEQSQATNLSHSTSDTFLIPKTDLTLRFHQSLPLLDPTNLKSLFLEASSDIQHQIDQGSASAASSERWFNYTSDDGVVLEIWNTSVSPEEYVSLAELRNVINGLSLYMMQQRRSRTLEFQIIQNLGATKAVIMNIGSIRLDVALLDTRAKRVVPLSPLAQNSSASSVTGSLNTSTLSLLTANDFPIPDTDYSLRFGNLGSRLHPWDLETLLLAVSANIKDEIAAHGRIARLPSAEYSKNLAGLELWIEKMPWVTVNLAWAELAIIVDGLWLYIVDEGHDREAFIDIFNHVTSRQVALGWIGKPLGPLEGTPLTEIARRGLETLASRRMS